MSFLAQLRDLLEPPAAADGLSDTGEPLTVAALLTIVAHVDGRLRPAEEEALRHLLQKRFGLDHGRTERLLAQAAGLEGQIDPATTLVDRILHDVRAEERPRILALAWRIAAADGVVHEFEDDLVWRTGRLLGLSEKELAAIKADGLAAAGREAAHG